MDRFSARAITIGFVCVLTVVLLAIKLSWFPGCPWLVVFAPFIVLAVYAGIVLLMVGSLIVGSKVVNLFRDKRRGGRELNK